jgi:hypothetical protein
MTILSAQSIRIGTTILAAVSLAVGLMLATRAMAQPAEAAPVPDVAAAAAR